MKKTNIIRNVLAVSSILSAFLPFGAFAGPQLPAGFVKPTLQAPQVSDLVIVSLQNQVASQQRQISSLQMENDDLRTRLKVELCPEQVDECIRSCYTSDEVCRETESEPSTRSHDNRVPGTNYLYAGANAGFFKDVTNAENNLADVARSLTERSCVERCRGEGQDERIREFR